MSVVEYSYKYIRGHRHKDQDTDASGRRVTFAAIDVQSFYFIRKSQRYAQGQLNQAQTRSKFY